MLRKAGLAGPGRILGPAGASWGLLGPSGAFWGQLKPLRKSRGLLKVSWGQLKLLGPAGASWGLLGPSGAFWGQSSYKQVGAIEVASDSTWKSEHGVEESRYLKSNAQGIHHSRYNETLYKATNAQEI